ncbi:MAG: 16S rRNA (cytidine(1402)-2'-O)-methyltransferase, partial [Alphaproteobacteria bacterium]
PLVTYNDHSTDSDRERILAPLREGGTAALVSDAGTPLVSDPGYRLVADAVEAGIAVIPVPGASAVLAALSGAGLPTDRFFFAGFLPPKTVARKKAIGELATVAATLVFFEAPQRLAACLGDLSDILGADRPASVCRELTKLYETFARGTLGTLAAQYGDESAGRVKGEIVIVIGPPDPDNQLADDDEIDRQLTGALAHMSVRDAADAVTAATGRPRRDIYARALALKDRKAP